MNTPDQASGREAVRSIRTQPPGAPKPGTVSSSPTLSDPASEQLAVGAHPAPTQFDGVVHILQGLARSISDIRI